MDAQCVRGCPSIRGVICDVPCASRVRQNQQTKKNQPQAYRPWLVFNCVLLQQSVKFD